jgi:hypothetical protein
LSIGNSRFIVIFTVFFSSGVGLSGTVQRFRLLPDSTGGGGYAPGHFRAVSPPNRFQPKRLPSLLEKSRKRKKDLQTEVLKDWECGKNLKKLLKNYLTTLL